MNSLQISWEYKRTQRHGTKCTLCAAFTAADHTLANAKQKPCTFYTPAEQQGNISSDGDERLWWLPNFACAASSSLTRFPLCGARSLTPMPFRNFKGLLLMHVIMHDGLVFSKKKEEKCPTCPQEQKKGFM
jgi:hypothetical protein